MGDDVRCGRCATGMVQNDRGWTCPVCSGRATVAERDADRLAWALETVIALCGDAWNQIEGSAAPTRPRTAGIPRKCLTGAMRRGEPQSRSRGARWSSTGTPSRPEILTHVPSNQQLSATGGGYLW